MPQPHHRLPQRRRPPLPRLQHHAPARLRQAAHFDLHILANHCPPNTSAPRAGDRLRTTQHPLPAAHLGRRLPPGRAPQPLGGRRRRPRRDRLGVRRCGLDTHHRRRTARRATRPHCRAAGPAFRGCGHAFAHHQRWPARAPTTSRQPRLRRARWSTRGPASLPDVLVGSARSAMASLPPGRSTRAASLSASPCLRPRRCCGSPGSDDHVDALSSTASADSAVSPHPARAQPPRRLTELRLVGAAQPRRSPAIRQ